MRLLFALTVVPLLLLAGCVAPEDAAPAATLGPDALGAGGVDGVLHRAEGATLALGDGLMPLARGAQFRIGASSVEPTIGVDKDGTIFMTGNARGMLPLLSPTIYRSEDEGQSWTAVGAPTHATTLDPYVYVDPATGRVFQDDIQPLTCGTLSFSDNKGQSWTTNPVGCGNPQVNDHQTLVAAKARRLATVGYPNLLYRCVNNVAYSACAVSVNGGISFLPQVPLASEPGIDPKHNGALGPVCSALTGHVKAAPDGTVYLPTRDCSVSQSMPLVSVTQDDGLTWTTRVIHKELLSDGHDVGIAVDEAGTVYANWISDGRMLLAHSEDQGKTWSEPIDVTAPGVTATSFNAVAAGAPGRVALAYIGTDIPDGYEGKTSADDWKGAAWNAYITVLTDAMSEDPILQSVTANDPADPVARNECGRTRCGGMTDFIELVIDAEGRPWASFVDVCNDECSTDAEGKNKGNVGFAATLLTGPALRGELPELTAILPPPPP